VHVVVATLDGFRLRAALGADRPALVGRDREVNTLAGAWSRACGREGGFVVLSGEPGRLVLTVDAAADAPSARSRTAPS